jgi:AraC family transcriptional regulator
MQPSFVFSNEKKLIGLRKNMSLIDNKTVELWRDFMPKRQAIKHQVGTELFSLQVYPPHYFESFYPRIEFEKWAATEVSQTNEIPDTMEVFTLLGGWYAVFHYIGLSTDPKIFEYIYAQWLPNSGFKLDQRPHFEILGEKYKNNDPLSEEDIWIPIVKI